MEKNDLEMGVDRKSNVSEAGLSDVGFLNGDMRVVQVSCHRNHVMHDVCLTEFINANPRSMNYCPICRAPINCSDALAQQPAGDIVEAGSSRSWEDIDEEEVGDEESKESR